MDDPIDGSISTTFSSSDRSRGRVFWFCTAHKRFQFVCSCHRQWQRQKLPVSAAHGSLYKWFFWAPWMTSGQICGRFQPSIEYSTWQRLGFLSSLSCLWSRNFRSERHVRPDTSSSYEQQRPELWLCRQHCFCPCLMSMQTKIALLKKIDSTNLYQFLYRHCLCRPLRIFDEDKRSAVLDWQIASENGGLFDWEKKLAKVGQLRLFQKRGFRLSTQQLRIEFLIFFVCVYKMSSTFLRRRLY